MCCCKCHGPASPTDRFSCGPVHPIPEFGIGSPDGYVRLLPCEVRKVIDEAESWLDSLGRGGMHGAN